MKDMVNIFIDEISKVLTEHAKDGGCIVLTEDDSQETATSGSRWEMKRKKESGMLSEKECSVLEKAEDVILKRFQDCLNAEKPLSADSFRGFMNSTNTLERILKMKGVYSGPLSVKERDICEKAEDIILKQYQFWLDSEKPMSSDDFNAMMDSVKTMGWFSELKGAYS